MRVAILGAGLAGLACAHELERQGIQPDIFEKRHQVGERFPNVEVMPQVLHRQSRQDLVRYLRHELALPVQPAGALIRAVLHGPGHEVALEGLLGYLTIRGHDERSLERQLLRHLQSRIRYNSHPDPARLARTYDWVVVATGDQEVTRALGLWRRDLAAWVRGAVVRGEFAPGEMHMWLNTDYAKVGYGYLAPFDQRHAWVMVAVPDSNSDEVDRYWQCFRRREHGDWVEELQAKMEKVEFGRASRVVQDNLILVGNAGGFAEPLIGCGQCSSMASGVLAARQVVRRDGCFEQFARQWQRYYRRLLRLRQAVNHLDNAGFDRFVRALALPGMRSLLFRSPFNWISAAGAAAGLLYHGDDGPDADLEPMRD